MQPGKETLPFLASVLMVSAMAILGVIDNVVILLVTYVIPILLIGVCSAHMSVVLWLRPPVGVVTPQLSRARRKKQKVNRGQQTLMHNCI